jgi:hypothetical protein
VILARFVYTNYLLGEWTPINPHAPMMVPNPEYAGRLIGVEFMESQNETPVNPKRHPGRAYRTGTVANGDCINPKTADHAA